MNPFSRMPPAVLRSICAISFALMLASAFPPIGNAEIAWISLVPLLILVRFTAPGKAFKWGVGAGFLFWLVSLSFLLRLSDTGGPWWLVGPGWIGLAAYCAVYVGAFAMCASWLTGRLDVEQFEGGLSSTDVPAGKQQRLDFGVRREDLRGRGFGGTLWRSCLLVVLIPMLWVGMEYLRSTFITGFPWCTLGVSQYKRLAIIQVAEWGGVYAVSALIMMVNAALFLTIMRFVNVYILKRPDPSPVRPELMLALMLCAGCWLWGGRTVRELRKDDLSAKTIQVAAVQPNIPQLKKWTPEFEAEIYGSLEAQTEVAIACKPELIVWPETAVPRPVTYDAPTADFVAGLAARGAPILVGSMEVESAEGKYRFYNSSFLIATNGTVAGTYRKRHLVLFGEYLPFSHTFSILDSVAPLGVNCWPGDVSTVFHHGRRDAPFSVLICFEDILPWLARECVRKGVAFLVVQTNDAWYEGTAGSVQHMSHCVFRCVENRISVVRAANTGVTCVIDRTGRFVALESEGRQTGFAGAAVYDVKLREPGARLTFYARYGDMPFALPCGVMAGLGFAALVGAGFRGRGKQKQPAG